MILNSVILPGVDPPDILRKTMNFSMALCFCPALIFVTTELMSGQFGGFRSLSMTVAETIVLAALFFSLIAFIPVTAWIQFQGTSKISDYLSRNGQILERQLMGALARVYRSSQITKMFLLLIPTTIGLIDAEITRSRLGLVVYLVGQTLLFINLPWPTRCNLWMEIKRREVLR